MAHDRDVFSFELNESLYFEKGHEVSEMVGIALDPEISIQTYNDYVSIRGVIELQGEYIKANSSYNSNDDHSTLNFEDYQSRRYLERVEDTSDERAIFTHRFPVEISVPLYRVANLNDVAVSIESFDYEVPQPNHLKLKSTIDIYGISQESNHAYEKVNFRHDEEESDPTPAIELEDTFEFDIKEEPKEDDSQAEKRTADLSFEIDEENKEQEEQEQSDRWKMTKTQSFAEFFKTEQDKQTDTSEDITDNTIEAEEILETEDVISAEDEAEFSMEGELAEKEVIEETYRPDELVIEEDSPEVDIEIDESVTRDEDDEDEDLDEAEDVSYLADMFRHEEEDSQYTRMRLCIVQSQDTIETIAEKYEITPSQIIKRNQLEDDDLAEGQLLYIPVKK